MQSKARTVDAYMTEVPPARQAAIAELRELCRKVLVGYDENMQYGMPGYAKDGTVRVAFNSQKQYISLYIAPAVVAANRDLLAGISCGKSCIRYKRPEHINFDVVRKLLQETVSTDAVI